MEALDVRGLPRCAGPTNTDGGDSRGATKIGPGERQQIGVVGQLHDLRAVHYVRQLVIGQGRIADRRALGKKSQHLLDLLV